ncbi:MAG: nodulation protein NfeD [Candidatus Eisenbacteria bacterium]
MASHPFLFRTLGRTLAVLGLFGLLLFPAPPAVPEEDAPDRRAAEDEEAPGSPPRVLWVAYQGVIGTVTSNYFVDAVDAANEGDYDALVIEIDTPGGLDTAMRAIIKEIMGSAAPVILYVSPSGSRAASAGAVIALASHAVAMAPGTNVGAAHPVNLGGGGQADSTITQKATNDAVAYVRSIAAERGRDPEWAEDAVRKSVSASAREAFELGIADCIAKDRAELFEKLDGLRVKTTEGETELRLAGASVDDFPMGRRYRFLAFLNDPNVAYILLLLGFYGLFFEISSPGTVLPGVVGAICLVLGLFALQSFSINYAGLMLMILGVVFFVAELLTPTYGVLSAGGVAALTLGSILLFRSPEPFYRVSLSVVVPALLVTVAFFVFATFMAVRVRRRPPTTGRRGMVGAVGTARTRLDPRGKVFVSGAHWTAESKTPVEEGERVIVERAEGLVLTVRPADAQRKDG